MNDLAIFSVGHARTRWLAARIAATATNVANADSPGFKARDVAPFDAVLKSATVGLRRTQPGHIAVPGDEARAYETVVRASDATKHSGNAVSLETEMADLGETRAQQSAVTGIIGAFHRMLLASTKG